MCPQKCLFMNEVTFVPICICIVAMARTINMYVHSLIRSLRAYSHRPSVSALMDIMDSQFRQSDALTASFTPTPKVSWKIEAFSLCMFLLLPTLREVPHGTKGTGPKFVTRPVYSRSQLQEQHEHSFCSSSTNAFIPCSLYTVRRYCTSPGAPDLRARLG